MDCGRYLRGTSVGCWMLDVGYLILDVGCWILDTGCWILDVGYLILGGDTVSRNTQPVAHK